MGEALKQGFEVLKKDDSPASLPRELAITTLIKQADLMVMLISAGLTTWAMREIDAAMNRQLPIRPILIGAESALPEQVLHGSQAITLKDVSDPTKIAPLVAKQSKTQSSSEIDRKIESPEREIKNPSQAINGLETVSRSTRTWAGTSR